MNNRCKVEWFLKSRSSSRRPQVAGPASVLPKTGSPTTDSIKTGSTKTGSIKTGSIKTGSTKTGIPQIVGISLGFLLLLTSCLPVEDYQAAPPEKDDIEFDINRGFHYARMDKLEAARSSFQSAIEKAEELSPGPWRDELQSKAYMARGDFWVSRSHAMRAALDYERAKDTAAKLQLDEVMARLVLVARIRGKESDESYYLAKLSGGGRTRMTQLQKTLFAEMMAVPIEFTPEAPDVITQDLEIIPRQSWSPRAMKSNKSRMVPIFRATVHHSGTGAIHETNRQTVAGLIRSIQRTHQDAQKWADIGYHFVIDPAGRVWQARPLEWQGSHAGGNNNRGNLGVCVLGNFNIQTLNPQQERSLTMFLELVMERYGFTAESVFPHQKFKVTDCPGNALLTYVANFKSAKRSTYSAVAPRTPEPTGSWNLAALLQAEGIEFLPSCEDAAESSIELDWRNPFDGQIYPRLRSSDGDSSDGNSRTRIMASTPDSLRWLKTEQDGRGSR